MMNCVKAETEANKPQWSIEEILVVQCTEQCSSSLFACLCANPRALGTVLNILEQRSSSGNDISNIFLPH